MEQTAPVRHRLSLLETVRCLDCGEIYSKPAEGGTVNQNPGCPSCGYVGWLSVSLPAAAPTAQHRSDVDQRRRPIVRSG